MSEILAAPHTVINIQNYAWIKFENKNNGIYALNFIFDAKADSLNKKVSAQIGFAPDYTLEIKNYVNRMHISNLVYKEVVSSFYKINIHAAKLNLTVFLTHNGVVGTVSIFGETHS